MSTNEIGTKYVALCKEGKHEQIISEMFASDVLSSEAFSPPGAGERTAKGLDAVRAKNKWWSDNHTVHKAEIFGPFPSSGDQFAVRFLYDITFKASNKRFTMEEIGLFTVSNAKIVKEEFFYTGG
jgi:hypothetical protein